MSWQGWAQIVLCIALLVLAAKPLGAYMARVFEGTPVLLEKGLGWLERLIYRACGVSLDPQAREMKWTTYAGAMLLFNVAGILVVYGVQRLQGVLPLNPDGMGAVTAGPLVEHRRQLRDQHELAELRRRDDHELLHADGRAGRAELRLRRLRAWP